MLDYARLEQVLTDTLHLTRRPVAITFSDRAPDGVASLAGSQPSGCSFWRLAADGHVFSTVPSDHYNCPIGSYTHHIPLPPDRESELPQALSLMANVGYIRMEEVPGVPRLQRTPAFITYAPLALTPADPDVVLVAGTPARLMLLHEAAVRASKQVLPLLGRPTCMAIPAAISRGIASSLGCIGNRVYTGISDDHFYAVVAGWDLTSLVAELSTIASANAALAEYHEGRRTMLTSVPDQA